jgi:GT2 family glycosyltransferase
VVTGQPPPDISSAVVICTKSRPDEVASACEGVARDRSTATIVILDASDDDMTLIRCREIAKSHSELTVHHVKAARPGLARQRNEAARFCEQLGMNIVHFIDDDIEILPGYLNAIEDRFRIDRGLAGVGGYITNMPTETHPRLNAFFLLSGKVPHTIRKSGRVVVVQGPNGAKRSQVPEEVDWLQGASMSYRIETLRAFEFDERLSGYSHGEDRDFSFRVSRKHRLAVEPNACCIHHGETANPTNARKYAYERTVLEYAWVRDQREYGLSRVAFLWSAFGEFVMYLGAALSGITTRTRDPMGYSRGVLAGVRDIALGKDPYREDPEQARRSGG